MRHVLDTARVAFTYVGTVIGAGFASGQELVQFFVSYGTIGLAGLALCGVLFAWLGAYILQLGHTLRASGYHQVLHYACGRPAGLVLDNITAFFLFGGLTIMLAGAGAVCRDYFGLNYNTGLAAMALIVAMTVMTGMKGISLINVIVTPLLIISTVVIGVNSLIYHGVSPGLLAIPPLPGKQPAPNWLLAGLLYASYNLILGATVLAPLGAQVTSRQARLAGGVLGGMVLTLLGLFIVIVTMLHYPRILSYEVPMLYISEAQQGLSHYGYACMLIKAMYSTALASLYGCTSKFQSATGLAFLPSLLILTAVALAVSQLGFANLIGLLYPFFGYAALIFTVRLIWLSLRDSLWR
ncbi:conserved hypothetical protein [Thermosinus carboxydivorans Nor1]|uniref:Membrane protein YkvI n=1 Tax=Thermosinus carboxydivorans Nor1 TaxID=401526 RepID=A1HUB5_9FIRM|nr:hypothetical protein [Thermosinus carboxydivorans]EAX46373.1 conserved hypothetical protein [Thermosinus carboxydivorans Nor1]